MEGCDIETLKPGLLFHNASLRRPYIGIPSRGNALVVFVSEYDNGRTHCQMCYMII